LGEITIAAWAPTWLASKAGRKATSRADYDSLWRTHVEPRWGRTPLRRVTYADALTWIAELTQSGLSPSRVNKCLLVLKQLLQLAVDDGRLSRSVVARIRPLRAPRSEPRFLTHEQLLALASECGRQGKQYETLVLLVGFTGLRWGEVRALRVGDVDLLRRRVTVAHNLPDGAREDEVVSPKSHLRRTVPFPASLTGDLALLAAEQGNSALIFRNGRGGVLDNSNFRRHGFDPAVSVIGVAPFIPHNLRDTAASLAVSAGANVKVVQRMLGHASAAMTLDVYAALFVDDLDEVAMRLDEAHLRARERHERSSDAVVVDLAAQRAADQMRTARLPTSSRSLHCCSSHRVRRQGLEPRTRGLRVT